MKSSWWPSDGGPIYAETPIHAQHVEGLVEPWNALSSLLIVAPAIYFLIRLRGNFKGNWILAVCIPLLVAGGLGSTLFHGLRSSSFFLQLDVWPTMLLFLVITAYFWAKALRNWWLAIGVMLAAFGLTLLLFRLPLKIDNQTKVNIAYALRGTVFLLPLVVMLLQTKFKHAALVFGSLVAFCAALAFRTFDKEAVQWLPMGSHFLWHSFTGIGGFLIAEYLLKQNLQNSLNSRA
jgi:hypothetical protein